MNGVNKQFTSQSRVTGIAIKIAFCRSTLLISRLHQPSAFPCVLMECQPVRPGDWHLQLPPAIVPHACHRIHANTYPSNTIVPNRAKSCTGNPPRHPRVSTLSGDNFTISFLTMLSPGNH